MSEHEERHFLVVAGTGKYVHLDPLPKVYDDIATISNVFCELGYIEAFQTGIRDPDSPQSLKEKLDEWARTTVQPEDIIVVYYSGHGQRSADRHYLLTSNSDPSGLIATAMATEDLIGILTERRVRRLLLLIDTCLAGRGTADLFRREAQRLKEALVSSAAEAQSSDALLAFSVIAATGPRDYAQDGAFSSAIRTAINDERLGGQRQSHLYLEPLTDRINEELGSQGASQHAELGMLRGGSSKFVPNPRFRSDLPVEGTDLAEQHTWASEQERQRREELVSHFAPRGLGQETGADSGNYFTGRMAVLKYLVSWLQGKEDTNSRTIVLSGSAGVGKSAVIGRLVILSDPLERHRIRIKDIPEDQSLPIGTISVAVHARRKTQADIVAALADAAGINAASPRDLIRGLSSRKAAFTVAIDALDEAGTTADGHGPERIAKSLVRELGEVPCVRLLIGCRPHLVAALGPDARRINLEDSMWVEESDIARYATLLLKEPDGAGSHGRIRSRQIPPVAQAVARRSYPNFLIARLTSRVLADHADSTIPKKSDWQDKLPASLDKAFEWALNNELGEQANRARRLLLPLALAEGAGLPWGNIWPLLATALGNEPVTHADIRWLLRNANRYVVEGLDQVGRSVYRLYHQSLADDLIKIVPADAQRRIASALIESVPSVSEDIPVRDWARADPYILLHLATHAAAGGILDRLLRDPEFLVFAEPATLVAALGKPKEQQAQISGAIYRTSYDQHYRESRIIRRQMLIYDALRYGEYPLSRDLATVTTPWRCLWATGSQITPSILATLVGHKSAEVFSVKCLTLANGTPIAITAGEDRTIRSWDLVSLRPFAEPINVAGIYSMGAAQLPDGTPIAVTASGKDRIVQVWDVSSSRLLGERLASGAVAVSCARLLDGRPVAVTVSTSGEAHIWDLTTYKSLRKLPSFADDAPRERPDFDYMNPFMVCVYMPDGTPLAVIEEHEEYRSVLRILNLTNFKFLSQTRQKFYGLIGASFTCLPNGRTSMLLSTNSEGSYTIDMSIRPLKARRFSEGTTASISMTMPDDSTIAIAEHDDGRVYTWNLTSRKPIGEPLTEDTRTMASIDCITLPNGSQVAVTGGRDGRVRVWDPGMNQRIGNPLIGHSDRVASAACIQLDDGLAVGITTSDEMVRVWDLGTFRSISDGLGGHTDQVTAAACMRLADGQSVAVTVDVVSLRAWSLHDLQPVGRYSGRLYNGALSVACTLLGDGTPVAVTGNESGAVAVWEVDTLDLWNPRLGSHADRVLAVACAELPGGTPVAVTGSADRTVRIWDLHYDGPLGAPLRGHSGAVYAVACTQLPDGTPVAITGSADKTVRVWDLFRRLPLGPPLRGHSGAVYAVACTQLPDGTPVAITGSADGTVRAWDLIRRQPLPGLLVLPDEIQALSITPSGGILLGSGWEVAVFRPPWHSK